MSQRPDADQTSDRRVGLTASLPVLSTGGRSSGGAWRSWPPAACPRSRGSTIPAWRSRVAGDPSRRDFFRFMAASLALGGLTGCAVQPAESIVPYVEQPERIVPGKPLFFATAIATDGFGLGVLVESHDGPARPRSRATPTIRPAWAPPTSFAQAAILDFYDPDRSQVVTQDGRVETWVHFRGDVPRPARAEARTNEGRRPDAS